MPVCACTTVCVPDCEGTCHMCACISRLITCEHSQTLTIQCKLTANMASVCKVWSEIMLMIRELGVRQTIWHCAAVFNLEASSLKEWVPKAAPDWTPASHDTVCSHLHSVEFGSSHTVEQFIRWATEITFYQISRECDVLSYRFSTWKYFDLDKSSKNHRRQPNEQYEGICWWANWSPSMTSWHVFEKPD